MQKISTLKLSLLAGAAAITVSAHSSPAQAAGFFLQEQSISGLGSAYAGETATGRDASAVFFNPAAMTKLEGATVTGGIHILSPSSNVKNDGTTSTVLGVTTATVGEGGESPYQTTLLPNFFLATPLLDNRLWLGYGATAPFGLQSDYGKTWFGRYDSTRTRLATHNHSLTAAYKINDMFSLGGGVDYQTVDAKLDRNAAFNGASVTDVQVQLAGDDTTIGWNAGFLVTPKQGLDIGFHYRSAISHEMKGEVRTLLPAALGGGFSIVDATADLDLPDIASLGFSWDVNDRWKALGSVNWYGWSNFKEIRIVRDGQPDSVTTQDYDDTLAFSIGAEYKYDEMWTFRGGVQYDPTPTNDEFRTSLTPDGDRWWLTTGATGKISDNVTFDIGAAYIDIGDESINVTRAGAAAGRSSNVVANTDGSVAIVSFGLSYKF